MREIALHLLDIAQNSVAAQSRSISVQVIEDLFHDRMIVSVSDDGNGMDSQTVQQVQDPFYTTRMTRSVGLGIPLLKLAAEAAGGNLRLHSQPGKGTWMQAELQHSHIDRMPLGDLPATCLSLLVSHPQINWTFLYRVVDPDEHSRDFLFESAALKRELGNISLTEPEVLAYLRNLFEEGIRSVAQQTIVES